MAMSENSVKVLNYLKENVGTDLTAQDVANALGFEKKSSVDGIFTAFQKKEFGIRVPGEIEMEDGTHKTVKFLQLTDKGIAYDPTADAE